MYYFSLFILFYFYTFLQPKYNSSSSLNDSNLINGFNCKLVDDCLTRLSVALIISHS